LKGVIDMDKSLYLRVDTVVHIFHQLLSIIKVQREGNRRANMKLKAYLGFCKDDKELPTVITMTQEAIASSDPIAHLLGDE